MVVQLCAESLVQVYSELIIGVFICLVRAARCVITQLARPLCFAAFSFFLQREISAVSRPIAAKLCHMIGNGCNFKH